MSIDSSESQGKPSDGHRIGRNLFPNLEQKTAELFGKFPRISKRIQHMQEEKGGVFYGLGKVTAERSGTKSLSLRASRAETMKQLLQMKDELRSKRAAGETIDPKTVLSEIRTISKKEQQRKKITQELHDSTLQTIDRKYYGGVGGQISVLNKDAQGIPIVFIPGSSNDPVSMEAFVVELALQTNRKIIVIGYPEAPNGKITKQFADGVQDSYHASVKKSKESGEMVAPSYRPYSTYFREQIKSVMTTKDEQGNEIMNDFQLMGFSAGGAISAKLLNSEVFGDHIKDTLFLSPAGSASFSDRSFALGAVRQSLQLMKDGMKNVRTVWIDDTRKNIDAIRKRQTWKALYDGCHIKIPDWKQLKANGRHISVYSGGQDELTRSRDSFSETKTENPQIQVLYDPQGHHGTLVVNAEQSVNRILAEMKWFKNDNNSGIG